MDFETYEIDIDFNSPQLSSNVMIDITNTVEKECPIAKEFGHIGIGEGVVYITDVLRVKENGNDFSKELNELLENCLPKNKTCFLTIHNHKLYLGKDVLVDIPNLLLEKEIRQLSSRESWKVKGEKHSNSKVKTLAPIDIEKLNSITEFVNYSVTNARFEQALTETFKTGEEIDVKRTGDLIRWMVKDINTEEMDVMVGNDLTPKDVNKYISHKCKEMFFKKLENSFDN